MTGQTKSNGTLSHCDCGLTVQGCMCGNAHAGGAMAAPGAIGCLPCVAAVSAAALSGTRVFVHTALGLAASPGCTLILTDALY